MNINKPTATIFLDTRKSKSTGKFPLKLTIYFRLEKKRYRTGIDLTKDEWAKINSERLKDENLKEKRMEINAVKTKAEKLLEKIIPFSLQEFEDRFFEKVTVKTQLSLNHWFNQYILQLQIEERIGTISLYKTTLSSINDFKPNLKLTDITKDFLDSYEKFMIHKGKSLSTIGVYLRNLRAIINRSILQGAIKQESYPFKQYKIPGSRNVKKALQDTDLLHLLNYATDNEYKKRAYDLWVFSYLCNGMNFTDILHLKPSDINGNYLSFTRRKTIRTKKRDLRPIKVYLHPKAKEIIKIWRNPDPDSDFLFPFLEKGIPAKTANNRVHRCIKYVNKVMNEIRIELGIQQKVRTYEARHSFSTKLMRKGVATQYIKESLGHSSVAVTENYLGDFADSVKAEYSELLTDFD